MLRCLLCSLEASVWHTANASRLHVEHNDHSNLASNFGLAEPRKYIRLRRVVAVTMAGSSSGAA